MPRKPARPKPVQVDPIRARVVRGPHADGSGRWYWRAEVTDAGDARPRTVWTGWEVPERLADVLVDIRSKGLHHADRERATPTEGAAPWGTVRRLLQEWLTERRDHVVPRERGVRRPRGTLTDATWNNYRVKAGHLARHLGDIPTRSLRAHDLERYRQARTEEGHRMKRKGPTQPSTVNLELQVLRLAWTWGRRDGFSEAWDLPTAIGSTRASRERVTPTDEEVARVVAELDGWRRSVFVLLTATGARIGDLARLRWADVDIESGWAAVDGKSGPERSSIRRVPLMPEALEELRALRPEHPNPAALVFGVGERTVRGFSSALGIACRRAGLPVERTFTPHALRRLAVDNFRRAGIAPEVVARALGHSVAVMLEVYRSVQDEEVVQAYQVAGLGTRRKVLELVKDDTAAG